MTSGNRPGGANPTGQPTGGGPSSHDRVRKELADVLNRLVRLEYDVGTAYESALRRVDTESLRAALKQQELEHGGHIAQLQSRVIELGHKPSDRADYHRILDKARVIFGEIGGNRGVLLAMKANLEDLRDDLKGALSNPGFIDEDRKAIERAYMDSDRHARELADLAATCR